ncbi:MAG: hypothetical protein NFW17_03270 [Candidatus Accumulibacter sp.]|uniref:hypothetical protein n=1 Tax=Accumulibacter sp. TaxID=2053492 RepID=UPI0025D4BDD8|nr:hypothetical protein [Accumulibacter sp.]MCM8611095.1 hypothetical protein [Accumulibacter sp.]
MIVLICLSSNESDSSGHAARPRRLAGHLCQAIGVRVQLDPDTVGEMLARRVVQRVLAGHQEQPLAARKEKAAGVGPPPRFPKVQMRAAVRSMVSITG